MGLYDHLPVYKACYDLLLALFDMTKNLPREYKYTVGEKLKNEALELIVNIYRINSSKQKEPLIIKARETVEAIRIYLRILKDIKQIDLKKFIFVNEKIELASKQLTGWQHSVQVK
jgi:hypothetical protein